MNWSRPTQYRFVSVTLLFALVLSWPAFAADEQKGLFQKCGSALVDLAKRSLGLSTKVQTPRPSLEMNAQKLRKLVAEPSSVQMPGAEYVEAARYIEEKDGPDVAVQIFGFAKDWYDAARIYRAQGNHAKAEEIATTIRSQKQIGEKGYDDDPVIIAKYTDASGKNLNSRYGKPEDIPGNTTTITFSDGNQIEQRVGKESERSKQLQELFAKLHRMSGRGRLFGNHIRETGALVLEYEDGSLHIHYWESNEFDHVKGQIYFQNEEVQRAKRAYHIHTHPNLETAEKKISEGVDYPFSPRDVHSGIGMKRDLDNNFGRTEPLPVEMIVLLDMARGEERYLSWGVQQPRNVILEESAKHVAKNLLSVLFQAGSLPTLANVYQFGSSESSDVKSGTRFRFLPKDSWGEPPQLQGKNFILAIPLNNKADGIRLIQEIARASGIISLDSKVEMESDKIGIVVAGKLYAYFHQAERIPATDERILELRITLDKGATADTAQQVLDGLKKLHVSPVQPEKIGFDLSTYSGRREWAYYSFHDWAESLTIDETRALRELAGPNYREIHSVLRKGDQASRWQTTITHLDQAISKGKLNRDITVWRTSSQQELFDAWNRLKLKSPTDVSLSKDPAFIFTSLDQKVANWWNLSELNGKGIMVEIRAPSGTPAAYIDAKGIEEDRGYQEIVFGRNIPMVGKEAKVDENGNPILVIELGK